MSVRGLAGLRALRGDKRGLFIKPDQLGRRNYSIVIDQGKNDMTNPRRKRSQALNEAFNGVHAFLIHLPSLSDRSQRRIRPFALRFTGGNL